MRNRHNEIVARLYQLFEEKIKIYTLGTRLPYHSICISLKVSVPPRSVTNIGTRLIHVADVTIIINGWRMKIIFNIKMLCQSDWCKFNYWTESNFGWMTVLGESHNIWLIANIDQRCSNAMTRTCVVHVQYRSIDVGFATVQLSLEPNVPSSVVFAPKSGELSYNVRYSITTRGHYTRSLCKT
jgi:hypothetical protein